MVNCSKPSGLILYQRRKKLNVASSSNPPPPPPPQEEPPPVQPVEENLIQRRRTAKTPFTDEQLAQMVELGNSVNWNLKEHRRDRKTIAAKCNKICISRNQFGAWVRYEKKVGRYPEAAAAAAASGSGSGSGSGGNGDEDTDPDAEV